jgi:hypothetical protein
VYIYRLSSLEVKLSGFVLVRQDTESRDRLLILFYWIDFCSNAFFVLCSKQKGMGGCIYPVIRISDIEDFGENWYKRITAECTRK